MVKTKRLSPVTILNPKVAGVVDAPEVAANDVKWVAEQDTDPVADVVVTPVVSHLLVAVFQY